jgi:homoserine O-succinyltransferase
MVVNIEASRFATRRPSIGAPNLRRSAESARPARSSECLTIGLLNNMAGTAFKATERQFISLLDSASEGIPVRVSFYTLPGLSDAESGGHHFASHYASAESLFDTQLDGLIVTGREPKMADLRDEPYWDSFTRVLEWARANTRSTVWSCLAAHAAILHMDGIGRRKSDEKNFGVFECMQVCDHPITQNLAPYFHVPHSRWNGVAQQDLTAHGYSVLSRVCGNGVDTFIKQQQSLFVFFQGHLEYEPDTLMREYRRDVGRFVKGQTDAYPLLPSGYFDPDTEQILNSLKDKASSFRGSELLAEVAAAAEQNAARETWRVTAARIYRNWLGCIETLKTQNTHVPESAPALSR